jgi:hypothetical protein
VAERSDREMLEKAGDYIGWARPLLEMLRAVSEQLEDLSTSRRNVARKIGYQRLSGPEMQK